MNLPSNWTFRAVLLGLFLATAAAAVPDANDAGEKLAPGKKPGTFHLIYHGQVTFTIEPAYPAVVSISNTFTGVAAQMKVTDDKPFTLAADLAPGTYWVESRLEGKHTESVYWPVNGGQLHIDKAGNLWRPLGPTDKLVHVHKIFGLSPADLEIAAADRTILKWKPVAGAKLYRGDFGAGESFKEFETTSAHYEIPKLQPPGTCEWELWAQDDKDQTLASGFASFFPHGTDPAVAERARSQPATRPVGQDFVFPTTGGYLGIEPTPFSVTKDPSKTKRFAGGAILMSRGDMIPCIMVAEAVPGSPALQAGLRPGDIIVAIDGKTIGGAESGVVSAFVNQIRAKRPGTVVTFTIRRDWAELKLPATIGPPPARANAPATQPAE